VDILCATSGIHYDKFIIHAGGCRMPKTADTSTLKTDSSGNQRSAENIHMDGMGILGFVNSRVPVQVRQILTRNNLTIDDIDLFIFHQASNIALDSLMNLLKIPSDKVYRNIAEIGNTVSASVPIALKEAAEKRLICRGSTVLLCGFGVGLSWGTAIVKI
jgi:3-oxoacyl-[acyl-carrier-protein] synthase-3